MRLIDADKLPRYGGRGGIVHWSDIEKAPTVDAVPLEWIENYLRNYRYMAPIEKCFVREMIKAWVERKDNG